ncbi:MAG: hypothetical protein CL666_14625 [Balneola sp.]|nr:hypothetical protein [Balneola sp.]|tara:strand:+ start:61245 stop:61604 length:360 start_codon:yes stop_codon:yes gene_type:complete
MENGLTLDTAEIIRLMSCAYQRGHQDTVDGISEPCQKGSNDIAIEVLLEEHPKYDICAHCRGEGWYEDHSDECYNHPGYCTNCPIQRECQYCDGTGLSLKEEFKPKQDYLLQDDDGLPF